MGRWNQINVDAAVLLSTTYFGPVQWYQKLYRYETVFLEQHESFQKQSFRNRCVIATSNGLQTLSVPVEHAPAPGPSISRGRGDAAAATSSSTLIRSLRVSNHGKWRAEHWNALQSAYGDSPFFDYYVDDLYPFFEKHWEYLFDFNLAIIRKICELLDFQPNIELTAEWGSAEAEDFRSAIHPKHPFPDPDFTPRPYYQVFSGKFGFQPNLSILDLLFNMGNEAIFYL